MTPGAATLLGLAQSVRSAEQQFTKGALYWATQKVQEIAGRVANGQQMNELGELQGTAAGFDAGVVAIEAYARSFKMAYEDIGSQGLDEYELAWLERMIEDSPRLKAIVTEADAK